MATLEIYQQKGKVEVIDLKKWCSDIFLKKCDTYYGTERVISYLNQYK